MVSSSVVVCLVFVTVVLATTVEQCPEYEIKTLTNDVTAAIAGIPLPFLGIHGASACAHVTRADTGEPAPCPLEPGHEYLYTNEFPIHKFYPSVRLRVHWGLSDGKRDVICFEVPAYIA